MKTFAYFLKALICIAVFLTVFVTFHPKSSDNYFNNWRDLLSFKPVINRVENAIERDGIQNVLSLYLIQAPIFEEIIYRGPVWLLCIVLGLMGCNSRWEKNVVVWPVLVIPALAWSFLHPYPPIYQAFVFLGGIVDGAVIIYLLEKKWSAASVFGSLTLAIYMHSALNLLALVIVWFFL